MATGDQTIFVSADLFKSVGGYPEISLMEDIALSKNLKTLRRPICLKNTVLTSSRRWEENGIVTHEVPKGNGEFPQNGANGHSLVTGGCRVASEKPQRQDPHPDPGSARVRYDGGPS